MSCDGVVVGVDIGGTKTAILVCAPDGTVLARSVAPTAVGAPNRAADAIATFVAAAVICVSPDRYGKRTSASVLATWRTSPNWCRT